MCFLLVKTWARSAKEICFGSPLFPGTVGMCACFPRSKFGFSDHLMKPTLHVQAAFIKLDQGLAVPVLRPSRGSARGFYCSDGSWGFFWQQEEALMTVYHIIIMDVDGNSFSCPCAGCTIPFFYDLQFK